MKLTKWAAVLAAGVSLAAAAELKVAVVNTGEAIFQSEEAKAYIENINRELQPSQVELQSIQEAIQGLREKATNEGDVLSDDEKRGLAKDIENQQLDFEFRAQKLQKDVQDRREELLQVMGPKVQLIVNDMVEVERYDLVFERSNVGYVNPRHDITAKVTEKLNERYAEERYVEERDAEDG